MDYKILKQNLEDLKLKDSEFNIGDSTIRKYIKEELIPSPKIRSLGRGKGSQSEYTEEALGQIYAAWKLLNGPIRTRLPILKIVRKYALHLLQTEQIFIESSVPDDYKINWSDLAYIMELWINYCEQVKDNYKKYRVNIEARNTQGVASITSNFPRKIICNHRL